MKGKLIAVLGNSHAAALKLGWDQLGGKLGGIAAVDFFARPNGQGGLQKLKLVNGAIETDDEALRAWFTRTAGTPRIEIARYDGFLLHSFGPRSQIVSRGAEALGEHRYSKALVERYLQDFRASVADMARSSPLTDLCRLLRSATDAPVLATHKPLFGDQPAGKPDTWAAGARLLGVFEDAYRDVLGELGCDLLPQPPATIVHGCFTVNAYATQDMRHMNGDFGIQLLNAAAERFTQAAC